MKTFKYITITVVMVLSAVGIGVCLWITALKDLNNRESAFLGVFIALLSILLSWLTSHIYAELSVAAARDDASANLRTYALKAAEKVTNLSNELAKLAGYLQAELDDNSYENAESNLQGKNERIQSAIHLLQTLKSVNDGSLSDWEGVIGDELENQRERDEEREEDLVELAERVDELAAAIDGHDAREAIEELRREMRSLAINTGVRPTLSARARKANKAKVDVTLTCPDCKADIRYKQRAKANSSKHVECSMCKAKFIARYDANGGKFCLEPRAVVDEIVTCGYCSKENLVKVDSMPGTATTVRCSNCGLRIRVTRTSVALKVATLPNEVQKMLVVPCSEEILTKVEAALPPQPWPKDIHRKVASDLNLSEVTVHSAIGELIRRGKYLRQYDGKLFVEAKPAGDVGDAPSAPKVNESVP